MQAEQMFGGGSGPAGASLRETVRKVMKHETKRFQACKRSNPLAVNQMRKIVAGGDAKYRIMRQEFQDHMSRKRETFHANMIIKQSEEMLRSMQIFAELQSLSRRCMQQKA